MSLCFQDPTSGRVLDKWNIATRDEEQVILQQFLRFGETKSIAQEIILSDTRENRERQPSAPSSSSVKSDSEIKKFIERSNMSIQQSYMRSYGATAALLTRPTIGTFAPPTTSASSSPRMLSPTAVMQAAYSPGSSNREALALTMQSPSPITSSPLTRLQGMQPFDYRREHISPISSHVNSDKSLPPSILSSKSPENLSLTTSNSTSPGASVSTGMSLNTTPVSTPKQEASEDLRGSAVSDDDSSDGIINYSTKASHPNPSEMVHHPGVLSASSVYADKKIKHLRKSSNPMKRQWQPNPTFGQAFISPSGKKRVLCTACNKTFCDKGALKIHYSAVHLKEMHKCTVEGCNMMFSSRRSRNRHSANPNPKLHMPTNKRKYPEGASLADESRPLPSPPSIPVVPTTSLPSSVPPTMAHIPTSLPVIPIEIKPVESSPDAKGVGPNMDQRYYIAQAAHLRAMEPTPSKMQKLDFDNDTTATTDLSKAKDTKIEPPPPANGGSGRRKRKSNVPTRCAQTDEIFLSDENSLEAHPDVSGLMPEDLSLKPSDSESGLLCSGDGPTDAEMYDDSNQSKNDSETEDLNTASSFHEIRENAIKHMDSISQAKLRDMCMDDEEQENGAENEIGPEMNMDLEKNMDDDSATPNVSTPNTSISPVSSLNTSGNISDADSELDAGLSQDDMTNNNDNDNGEDIPLDKENPKKCSACGRIFQNHFSLKTHYQNVHLKLMHTCNVEGCNAAFPSKRSRDRHSANLNLHRKLLSTSSTEADNKINTRGNSLRDEFLPRIYDNQNYHSNALLQRYELENSMNGAGGKSEENPEEHTNDNGTTLTNGNPDSPPPSPPSPVHEDERVNGETEMATEEHECSKADKDGMVKCHVCSQKFRDNLHLKEHFEKIHPKEMFHCTIKGCEKIFSTRKSRNRHSQNDNLHRHLSPSGIDRP